MADDGGKSTVKEGKGREEVLSVKREIRKTETIKRN